MQDRNTSAIDEGGCPSLGEDPPVIYGEPETSRFLAAVRRLKKQQRRKEQQTRQAKQRVRHLLRKMRGG